MMSLNNPHLWNPHSLEHAFFLVGGENPGIHLSEPQAVAANMAHHIRSGYCVLEVGCGFGRILRELADKLAETETDATLIGVDFCAQMIAYARTFTQGQKIQYNVVTEDIPLPPNSVDFLYTHAVLIHNDLAQLLRLFEDFRRVMKHGTVMRHDFLNGDNEQARQDSREALQVNFPLYCYSHAMITSIAYQHGFALLEGMQTPVRCTYSFEKVVD
jgi:ubiquinone/menaquinone biosynthesis C-methylase UbiE